MTEEQLAYIEANLASLSFDRSEDIARARASIGALIAEVRRLREELARERASWVVVPDRYTIINRPGSTEFLFGEREPEEPHR